MGGKSSLLWKEGLVGSQVPTEGGEGKEERNILMGLLACSVLLIQGFECSGCQSLLFNYNNNNYKILSQKIITDCLLFILE